jgi:hypothetical protein
MLSPMAKIPMEIGLGREAFSNRDLYPTPFEKVQANPAIDYAMDIPGLGSVLKKIMGAQEINSYWNPDVKVTGVSPNADYLTRQIPFLANLGKWTAAASPNELAAPGKNVPNLLTTLAGIKLMPYNQELEKKSVAYENMSMLKDYMSNLERQQGVNVHSDTTLQNFMRYQAGKPTMTKAKYMKTKGLEKGPEADDSYWQYLVEQSGVKWPISSAQMDEFKTLYDTDQITLPKAAKKTKLKKGYHYNAAGKQVKNTR